MAKAPRSSALHEAGHAVLAAVLGRRLLRVSIEREAGGNEIAEHTPDVFTRQAMAEEIAIMLAGGEAANLWGFITNIDDDEARALGAIRHHLLALNAEEWRERIRTCAVESVRVLKEPMAAFALELFQQRILDGPAASSIIQRMAGEQTGIRECQAGFLFSVPRIKQHVEFGSFQLSVYRPRLAVGSKTLPRWSVRPLIFRTGGAPLTRWARSAEVRC